MMNPSLENSDNSQSKCPLELIQINANTSEDSSEVKRLLTDTEVKCISLISPFLVVHPFGASTDYIWSFIQKCLPAILPSQLETILSKFPNLFRQEISG